MNVFFLRQATAGQVRAVGPFLDDEDFVTPKTGLTIANTDVKLLINGAASVNKNSGGGTHRVNGMYAFTFDATDSANVGDFQGSILVDGALIVVFRAVVLEEAVYDQLFAAAAPGAATVTEAAAIRAKTDNLPSDPADQSLLVSAADAILTAVGDVPTNSELATALAAADGAVLARLGAPAGASLSADIAAAKSDTGAIKTKTDQMTFTVANRLDINVRLINGTAVLGAGTTGNLWRGS